MKDINLIVKVLVLLMNVITFIYLLDESKVNYRLLRVLLLVTFTIGLIVTFGTVTWFSVLFSFSPALSLINITDGNIGRIGKKFRSHIRRDREPVQNIQGNHKALS